MCAQQGHCSSVAHPAHETLGVDLPLLSSPQGVDLAVSLLYPLLSLQECEQLQKMYGGQVDERALEKTQQQHMLYQQEQHHQILQQQIQVGLRSLFTFSSVFLNLLPGSLACALCEPVHCLKDSGQSGVGAVITGDVSDDAQKQQSESQTVLSVSSQE